MELAEKIEIKQPKFTSSNVPSINLDALGSTDTPETPIQSEVFARTVRYAKQSWNMEWEPVLKAVYGDKYSPEIEKLFKTKLLDHKLEMAKKSSDNKAAAQASGMPF